MIILRLTLDIYLSRLITKLLFFRRCVCFRSRRMYVCIVYVYTCSMRPFSIIVLMQIYGDKRMAFVPFLPLDVIHIKWLEWVIFLYVVLGWLYSYGRIIHIQWYRTLMELLQAFTVHTNISYNMKINWRSVLETKYRLLFCTAIVWADISFFTVWFHFLWEFWLRGRVPIYFLCTFNAFFSIFSYFPFFSVRPENSKVLFLILDEEFSKLCYLFRVAVSWQRCRTSNISTTIITNYVNQYFPSHCECGKVDMHTHSPWTCKIVW